MSGERLRAATASVLATWLVVLFLCGSTAALAAPPGASASAPYAADRLLVKFSPDASSAHVQALNARHGAREEDRVDRLGVRVLSFPKGSSAEALARTYARDPNVEFAEPDYVVHASKVPNDTYYTLQWAMPKISAPTAWDTTTGSTEVTIAIVDTGVDSGQPDLLGRVVAGYDFANSDADPSDDHGHGTACAGVIGANGGNGLGVAGMDWAARLLAVKVLDATGSGYESTVAQGITYAADNGARVISMSLGGPGGSSTLHDAVDYAYSKGSLIVAASGNDGTGTVSYPAAYPQVIAVGATDGNDTLASFSNYGAAQDVVAPGVSIATTYIGGMYVYFSGTSAATPLVAGLSGLLLAKDPSLTNAALESAIRAGAVDLGSAGWDQTYGWGRIDAARALSAVSSPDTVTISSATATPNPSTLGKAVSFTASASDSLGHVLAYQWSEGADGAVEHPDVLDGPASGGDPHDHRQGDVLEGNHLRQVRSRGGESCRCRHDHLRVRNTESGDYRAGGGLQRIGDRHARSHDRLSVARGVEGALELPEFLHVHTHRGHAHHHCESDLFERKGAQQVRLREGESD